ncbi:SDR family NAD(P)-dependent oxidoreductase [Actinophytocola sp.]|uniref:SDR family NAD(P)-dependent oxidoreductase n=1 Tax=Actinophytocola sp. TaxID=1872138 RepID=UPI003D6B000E
MTPPALFGPRRPVIVLGAAHGIGAAVVARLCAWEMVDEVVLVDQDAAGLEAVAAQGFPGVRLHPVIASLADDLTDACAVLDRPGYGVVTAGVFAGGPSLTVDRESIQRVVETDLVGAVLAARTVAARLAEVGGGSLAVLSSIAARVPRHEQLAYSAAKAGLSQAMRVLGMEVAPLGVRVNTVAPGATDTRFIPPHLDRTTLASGDGTTYRGRIPRGSITTADEVAQTVAVLLSPAMRHVYLHELVVDGGESLGV